MNRVCSIFSQLLQFFPRLEFEQAVRETRAERHARGFTCWGQFIAMLFCQLGQARSLREICGGLAGCEGKLKHLGVPQAPTSPRSPMPMSTAPGSCIRKFSAFCLRVANKRLAHGTVSVFAIHC